MTTNNTRGRGKTISYLQRFKVKQQRSQAEEEKLFKANQQRRQAEKERFFNVSAILLKYLKQRDAGMHANVKALFEELVDEHKAEGFAEDQFYRKCMLLIKQTIGELSWNEFMNWWKEMLAIRETKNQAVRNQGPAEVDHIQGPEVINQGQEERSVPALINARPGSTVSSLTEVDYAGGAVESEDNTRTSTISSLTEEEYASASGERMRYGRCECTRCRHGYYNPIARRRRPIAVHKYYRPVVVREYRPVNVKKWVLDGVYYDYV